MERITESQQQRFEEIANSDENAIELLWEEVAPHMAQRERARKAALLCLASHADKAGMRGRLHLLMVGPPGTGKTELRNWVRSNFPDAHGIGPKSSEAGLKGDASGDELTPGALSMAHGGILCIEELDKFSKSERDALYGSMSEGEYEINQAEIRRLIQAEIRAIATCNSTDPFKPAFRDRFDFVVEMDEYDAAETVQVSDKLMDGFMSAFVNGEVAADEQLLPAYLRWIAPYEPGAAEGYQETVGKMKNHLIRRCGLTGSIREKQSWLRTAYTIAKLNRRDMIPDDFIRAVGLLHPDLDQQDMQDLITIRDDGSLI